MHTDILPPPPPPVPLDQPTLSNEQPPADEQMPETLPPPPPPVPLGEDPGAA